MKEHLVRSVLGAVDGGVPREGPLPRVVSPEDQEVIDNLELLQNLEGASDLELLQELSLER